MIGTRNKSHSKVRSIPARVSAALFLLGSSIVFLIATGGDADAHKPRYVKRTVYQCVEGWWPVRDGSRYTHPSDGKWRPAWFERCRKVTVYVED